MPPPKVGLGIAINTSAHLGAFTAAVGRHLGDLKVGLRALEDGTFQAKATAPRAGALMQFQVAPGPIQEGAPARLCNRCFVSIVSELVTYLDRMISVERLCALQLVVPPGVRTRADLLDVVQSESEKAYQEVAGDVKLSNPRKLNHFVGLADFIRLSALSCFEVRRVLEHHGGRPLKDVALRYSRLKLMAGEVELTQPGRPAPVNTAISLGIAHDTRELQKGRPVELREDEIEHVVFTLQMLVGPEVRRVLNSRLPRPPKAKLWPL